MMNSRARLVTRRLAVMSAVPVLAALGLTACGSSGGGSAASSNPAAASSTSASAGGGATISTASGSMGTYLTADKGRAVYLWEADHGGKSNCKNACAAVWAPVLTTGMPHSAGSVKSADLGTIRRSDGTMQVTYDQHPLYYYAPDTSAGQTTGQGSNGFGAKWWLVAPSGSAITGGSSGKSSSSSGYGGY